MEQVCRELGVQYATEENAGRIYVNLSGGPADMPPPSSQPQQHQYPGQQHHYQQPHHQHAQPQPQPQRHNQQDPVEQVVQRVLPRVVRKLEKACCVVM